MHYDKYDPTRAGIYIDLPNFIKFKKRRVSISKTKIINVSNTVSNQ